MKIRLETVLSEIDMNKSDFARSLKVEPQNINNWILRGSIPKKYINKVEGLLNVRVEYLESGEMPKYLYDDNTTPASIKNRDFGTVPLISWVLAGSTHVAYLDDDRENYQMIECHNPHSKDTYALKVTGSSMTAPAGTKYTFPEGHIIIVDPDQSGDNTDGIFVIAKEVGNDAVTFKQLKYDGTTPYLNPLNPDYPKIFTEFRIIGKVIDVRSPALP